MKKLSKILYFLPAFIAFVSLSAEMISISFDYIFPINDFMKADAVMKELWSDLDLLQNNEELCDQMIYKSGYLEDQFLLLEREFDNLVSNPEMQIRYLTEDMEYLVSILDRIDEKFAKLQIRLLPEAKEKIVMMQALFEQTKSHMVKLAEANIEEGPADELE